MTKHLPRCKCGEATLLATQLWSVAERLLQGHPQSFSLLHCDVRRERGNHRSA